MLEEKLLVEMLRETGSKYELTGMERLASAGQNTPENTLPCPNTVISNYSQNNYILLKEKDCDT